MWPVDIILQAPGFDHNLGFKKELEPFALQALVAEFVVKAFDETILPGLTGWNEGWANAVLSQPELHGLRSEFTTVVGA